MVEVEGTAIGCIEILPVPYALSLRPGAIISNSSTDDDIAAVTGEISSSSPGLYSSGLRGFNNGTGQLGIGVFGSQDGSGWGVYGQVDGGGRGVFGKSDGDNGSGLYGLSEGECGVGVWGVANGESGIGVIGFSSVESGIGVYASDSAFTSTALLISSGSVRVNGAGLGTSTPVFIHQATASNIWGLHDENTNIDHPLTNGDPDAILFVTMNSNPYIIGVEENPHPVGVRYHPELPFWIIHNIDDAPMPIGATFNVFVVKP